MAVMQALHQAVQDQRLAHALLFTATKSAGLKSAALELAQHLVCDRATASGACGKCALCGRILNMQSENLTVIEPENGVIKIDQVRPVRQALALENWSGARIVILDQAETLNPQAANALLKSIEEPPPRTYFFLLSHRPSALLSTIRSRCQLVRLNLLVSGDNPMAAWQEHEELLQQSQAWWQDVARGSKPHDESWREVVREREDALRCVQLWSEILYQARRQSAHLTLTWKGLEKTTNQLAVNATALDLAWVSLLELKTEIEMQVDRALAVESFWLKVGAHYGL